MYKEVESLLNADIFIQCFRKFSPTFSVFYDNGVDCVSHFYWKYMEPEFFDHVDKESIKKYNDTIKRYYIRMDKVLGRIASVAGEDATLIVVSDHGFQACPSFKGEMNCTLFIDAALESLGLGDKAYGIRVFRGGLFRPKNDQTDLQELAETFKKVRFRDTGEDVFTVTLLGSHINVKINMQSILGEDQVVILPDSSECRLKTIVNFIPERSGDHSYSGGVIIIGGPKVLSGEPIKNATIFDLAPTILALRKMPIPDDMDGRVLTSIFKEPMSEKDFERVSSYDSGPSAIEPSVKEKLSNEQEESIKERLKELGYL
jgi:arylsulfatase A-like enzyme